LDNKFWESMEEYRRLGFDPLRWVPLCTNEVDSDTLHSSLKNIKRSTLKIIPSWFDAFYYTDGKPPELTRRIYNLDNPQIDREVDIKRALLIFRIQKEIGEDPVLLAESLRRFLKNFHSKVIIKKIAMSLTAYHDAQLAILDYIELHRGNKIGYITANNSTTQITDPTHGPESQIHSDIALTTAMENLNLLGCTSGFKLFPMYDAPNEEILDKIRKNLDAFTSRYNLTMEDYSSLKTGKLFFGTTALATTIKELPVRYDQVEEGMQIIISDRLGKLPAVCLYMLTEMDPSNIAKFEDNNILLNVLSSSKDEVIKNLSEPHLAFGKVISKYCPDFGTKFDKHAYITAVYPVTADGIFAIGKLAELTNSHIVINEIPMESEEIAKFATKEYLIENATASSNGCHLIVASKEISSTIIADLQKYSYKPTVIGFISKKGWPSVSIEKDISQYVASKSKLSRLDFREQAESQV